ncbi:MAG: hypothetical protein HYV62_05850 [Candidatus Rokubacteria bacterium]|nr:hypothetical protein [Candidatus Rokubacteria bacterium]
MTQARALFEFRTVADGVTVAVAAPAYKVNSNAVIIALDDGLIVVDTHSKPSAARALLAILRDLTQKPVRALLQAEIERGPEFLRLANALSALYPKDSEEKRLLDAMLLAAPR